MISHKLIALISIGIGFIGYIPYLRDMFKGKTKPHIFSWVVWAMLEFTAFGIQFKNGVGPGAWVTLFSAVIAMIIVIYSFRYRNLNIAKSDWLCFVGACVSLLFWLVFGQPLLASIFLLLTDFLAFLPTYRKSWSMPYDETIFSYGIASLKYLMAFFAFNSFEISSIIYPIYLIIANSVFVIYVLYRRKILKRPK